MVALLREFPSVRVTFNLVPSMLVQLEAFARDEARDRHLEIGLKPAEALTEEERTFAVANFFHAHGPRMIAPYPGMPNCSARRDAAGHQLSARGQSSNFSTDDLRDLQVWHKLAWMDPMFVAEDARLQALIAKGRGFSEEDKRDAARRRAGTAAARRARIPGGGRARAGRTVHLAFLPPDSPAALRHGCLPSHTSGLADAARAVSTSGGRGGTVIARGGVSRAAVRQPPRSVCGPRRGRSPTPWCRSWRAPGSQWMATDEEILARTQGRGFSRTGSGAGRAAGASVPTLPGRVMAKQRSPVDSATTPCPT